MVLLFIVAIALVAFIVKACTGANDSEQTSNTEPQSEQTNPNDSQVVQQKMINSNNKLKKRKKVLKITNLIPKVKSMRSNKKSRI